MIFDQIFTPPFEPCSHNSITVVTLLHAMACYYIPENVVADSLFDGHACLEKHGKVTYFVRQLMAQHGNGSGETGCEAFAEGSSDGKTIG